MWAGGSQPPVAGAGSYQLEIIPICAGAHFGYLLVNLVAAVIKNA